MVKDIITVVFNSLEVEKRTDGNNNNTLFTINTPPIIIRNKGILKVCNFCHIGESTGHTDNMYLFKIRGVIADTSRFITGNGGGSYPLILTTTFNNNRSLYDENVITLIKQTINAIDIIVDTYLPSATIKNNLYVFNGGSNYLVGQRLKLTIVSTDYEINVDSINSNGAINSISFIDTAPTTVFTTPPITNLTTFTNGSGASLTAVITTNAISSITINNAGLGYKVGQTLAFSGGGGSGANISIATVGSLGQILTFTITSGGTLYTSAPTVAINSTTQTQTANFAVSIGQIINDSIPTSLNFSITFIIEQDINE
jgi:hypothetical protein